MRLRMEKKKRVLLGMSGGVDSSTSAIILKQEGYEVIGCTMKLWEQNEPNKAVEDAKKVCKKLGIEHHVIDCRELFKNKVIDNFTGEYQKARTPNPCIQCNKYLKFGIFYQKAQELECEYIATGHYACIEFSEKYQQYILKKSKEEKKDQTYFLYTIPKEKLEHILFPLKNYTNKQDIRKVAQENGLEVAEKKDSQEICFIPDNDYQCFLEKELKQKPKTGNIVLKTGKILGKHKGLTHYTIGQRKGIGISYPKPLYVIELNPEKNEVIVGEETELYSKTLYANQTNWIVQIQEKTVTCYAKIRYRAKEALATVTIQENNEVKVEFEKPQRAITPGQSVIFYDKEGIVLGGGIIIK